MDQCGQGKGYVLLRVEKEQNNYTRQESVLQHARWAAEESVGKEAGKTGLSDGERPGTPAESI